VGRDFPVHREWRGGKTVTEVGTGEKKERRGLMAIQVIKCNGKSIAHRLDGEVHYLSEYVMCSACAITVMGEEKRAGCHMNPK
jgi:hypothetical protein